MGLTGVLLLQHARAAARFDAAGIDRAAPKTGSRPLERALIAEGLALTTRRCATPIGAVQVQAAIAALHDRAARPEDTDGGDRSALCDTGKDAAVAGDHAQPLGCRRQVRGRLRRWP